MSNTDLGSCLPQNGAKFQVIGAGLPRSGTNSFCAAVSTLLNGPAYQAAVQTALSPTSAHARALINIVNLRTKDPISEQQRNGAQQRKQKLKQALADEMTGYVASADAPLCLLVPELLEIYPDAIVVCSVRNREKWAKSMWNVAKLANPAVLYWLYFWVPVLRHSPVMWASQAPVWKDLYGTNIDSENDALTIWDRHHQWLREVVPKDKLFFADVTEGWEPLCRALGVPVPRDTSFPRLNDAEALEKTMQKFAVRGILAWVLAVVVFVGAMGFLWRMI